MFLIGGGNLISGREIVTIALGRGLRDLGHRVIFLTSRWDGKGEYAKRVQSLGFDVHRVRLGFLSLSLSVKPIWWTLDQLRYWPALVWVYLRLRRREAPGTVIHTNWHHTLLLLFFLNPRRDIYWSHEILPDNRLYGFVFRAIARRVRKIVCVSRAAADMLTAHGVAAEKIAVVYNGIALPDILGQPPASSPLRLGIAGQIAPWKGHADILEALGLLKDADIVLNVFGSGDEAFIAELKAIAARLGIGERIGWRGFVSRHADIYSQIDVCMVPSRFADPLPTSAIEASAHGRAVICSDMGGLPEIVCDGETGFVVPAARPDLLASAVRSFVEKPGIVITMGQAGRARAEREFSLSRFIQQFDQILQERPVS